MQITLRNCARALASFPGNFLFVILSRKHRFGLIKLTRRGRVGGRDGGAGRDIKIFPYGFDTLWAMRYNFSGGQKQDRIARAYCAAEDPDPRDVCLIDLYSRKIRDDAGGDGDRKA